MIRSLLVSIAIVVTACGNSPDAKNDSVEGESTLSPSTAEESKKKDLPIFSSDFSRVSYPEVDLDPGNDSLWYHLVIDIPGEMMLSVAQPIDDNNRKGIRMQLQTMNEDSTFNVHTESSPGYDSAKLYPSFYKDDEGRHIILADTGEKQSWGQKVYLLDNDQFYDLGFIDMGEVAYADDEVSGEPILAPTSIADRVSIKKDKKNLIFKISGDDLVLFDDTKGNLDTIVPADAYYYRLDKKRRFELKKEKS